MPVSGGPTRRSDLRTALHWTLAHPYRTVLVVLFLAASGAASVLDLLRWHQVLARWSFALLCWTTAMVVVIAALARARTRR